MTRAVTFVPLVLTAIIWALHPLAAQTVRLAAVGDVMMARGVEKQCRRSGWDYPFVNLSAILHSADLAFANLECPLTDRPVQSGGPVTFRADPACLPALKRTGFSLLSVANNHSMDCGAVGLEDTLAGLQRQDILAIGGGKTYSEAVAGEVVNKNGLRIGFLGYSLFPEAAGKFQPDRTSIAIMSDERLIRAIRSLKQRCDIVVLSCHWGFEGRTSHVAMQERLAHAAIDAGASLVLGHHPHVAQEIERYRSGVIAYSLGNCVFDVDSSSRSSGIVFQCVLSRTGVVSYTSQRINIRNGRPMIVAKR